MTPSKAILPQGFGHLLTTRTIFTFAVQMQAVVVGWQIYALTHSALALGLVGLAEAVPALGMALWAGWVVDQHDPFVIYRRVLWGSLASAAIIALAMLPDIDNTLVVSAQVRLGLLYLASVVTGAARAFAQPAMYAGIPRLVPRDVLPKAIAWMSGSLEVARISGPSFGGLLYGFAGAEVATFAVIAMLLLAIVSSLRLSGGTGPANVHVKPTGSRRQELLMGLQFVFSHPTLLPALSLDMISVLFGGVTAMLPIVADQILHIGPKGLGVLRAAPALGAVLGSVILSQIEVRPKAGHVLLWSVAGFGACIVGFAASQSFVLTMAALILSGFFDSASMLVRSLIVQLNSPEQMRGRISAVNSMFIGSSNELGELESGIAASVMGVVPSLYFGGLMCLLTVLAVTLFSPKLRRLNLLEA